MPDGERRAWRLTTLLGDRYDPTSMSVDLVRVDGAPQRLATPESLGGRVVVVATNRAGLLRVALVTAAEPFPPFHGRGGNRGRRRDPSRVKGVKRILLSRSAAR